MNETVKLRSLFGIHPFVSFVIRILFVFFLIAFVPSLLTNSRRVYVNTNVYPLRLEIDGQNCGITPTNVRVKRGNHNLKVYYADTLLHQEDFRVRSALFFSYIFEYSKRIKINIELSDDVKKQITADFLNDSLSGSTMFRTDSTHIQKPLFSYYNSLLHYFS